MKLSAIKIIVASVFCLLLFVAVQAQTAKPHPSEFIKDLPALEWGMKFDDAKAVIKKANIQSASPTKSLITWNAKFSEWEGRASILFNEKNALWEMAFVIWTYKQDGEKFIDQRQEAFEMWSKNLTAKYGKPSEVSDNEISKSHVWRLADGFTVELRLIKDKESTPAIDVHWVKEK